MKRAYLTGVAAALCAAALPVAAPATAAPPAATTAATQEASIPFANSGGIYDWQDAGENAVYVQDAQRRWYLATLMTPCLDLPYATRIGFDVRGTGRFDRFSSIIVRGRHYPLTSLVASGPPPTKAKAKKAA
jgi:hypothetical protein